MNSIRQDFIQTSLVNFEKALEDTQCLKTGKRETVPSPFGNILTKLTRDRVGSQWRSLSYVWSKYETGLDHAREGKLNSAELIFSEANSLRKELSQTEVMDRLVDIGALPAVAYLQYKKGLYAEAERSLITSIDSDAVLLKEGFYILDYHRVQQLHNLARLYFKQGQLRKGAQMIHKALRFMLCDEKLSLDGINGLGITNEYIPSSLRADMIYQLVGETCSIFISYPRLNAELCKLTFDKLTAWEPRTQDELFHLQFFKLQQDYVNDNLESFIGVSQLFLTTLPAHFDSYKLSLLINVVDYVTMQGIYTHSMKQTIDNFVKKLQVREQSKNVCLTYFHLKM